MLSFKLAFIISFEVALPLLYRTPKSFKLFDTFHQIPARISNSSMYYTSFIRRIVFFDVIRSDCFSKIRTAE